MNKDLEIVYEQWQKQTKRLHAVLDYHKPHLMGDDLICLGCTNMLRDYYVSYPCGTVQILNASPDE